MPRLLLLLAAVLGTHGCASNGTPHPPAPPDPHTLSGAAPPAETVGDQHARASEIAQRSDHITTTDVVGEIVAGDLALPTECTGIECRPVGPDLFISPPIEPLSFPEHARIRPVLSKHGITTMEAQTTDLHMYGAWLDHSGFAIASQRFTPSDETLSMTIEARYAVASGDRSTALPHIAQSATWTGLMTGTPRTAALRGNRLQGDATLIYVHTETQGPSVHVTFSQIVDLDRGAAHPTTQLRFADIPVSAHGTYEKRTADSHIEGAFYGPGHTESAGIFEHETANILGAFGTRR